MHPSSDLRLSTPLSHATWRLHCTHASLTHPYHLCPHRPLPCLPHSITACTHMITTCMHTPPCLHLPMHRHAIHCYAPLEPTPCKYTRLPHTPAPVPHRPLLCLPGCHARSQPAHINTTCTHTYACIYLSMPLPCQALYAPLSPTPCTHMCASLTHLPLCPHRPLLCLPHSIGACTHDHHMHIDIDMSLPIDASPCHSLTHP